MAIVMPHHILELQLDDLKRIIEVMTKVIEGLEARVDALEQVYMEENLLGKAKDSGKIEP